MNAKDDKEYRCKETIDLEEFLKMSEVPTKAKATIIWNSGREEEIVSELNKGGEFKKSFSDKINEYRKFPTVKSVNVTKY